jgi:hypothetical protein
MKSIIADEFPVLPCSDEFIPCSCDNNSLFLPTREFTRNKLNCRTNWRRPAPKPPKGRKIPCFFPCSQGIPHDLPKRARERFSAVVSTVVAGLVPAISMRRARAFLIGVAGTSPAMTSHLLDSRCRRDGTTAVASISRRAAGSTKLFTSISAMVGKWAPITSR